VYTHKKKNVGHDPSRLSVLLYCMIYKLAMMQKKSVQQSRGDTLKHQEGKIDTLTHTQHIFTHIHTNELWPTIGNEWEIDKHKFITIEL